MIRWVFYKYLNETADQTFLNEKDNGSETFANIINVYLRQMYWLIEGSAESNRYP